MNEQLIKILEKGYEMALKTGEFIIEEGSILIDQFLTWKLFETGFYMGLGIFLMIGTLLLIRALFVRPEEKYEKDSFLGNPTKFDSDELTVAYIILGVSFLAGIIVFVCNTLTFVKILVAPNVYLLEYIINNVR